MEHTELTKRPAFKIFEAICIVAFLLIMALAVLQVISRLLPDQLGGGLSFNWTTELATNLFIFVIFVGGAATQIRGEHITVSLLRDRISDRVPHLYEIVIHSIGLAFGLVVVSAAYSQTVSSWGSGGLALSWFHSGYLYGFIFVGFVIISLSEATFVLRHAIELYRERRGVDR